MAVIRLTLPGNQIQWRRQVLRSQRSLAPSLVNPTHSWMCAVQIRLLFRFFLSFVIYCVLLLLRRMGRAMSTASCQWIFFTALNSSSCHLLNLFKSRACGGRSTHPKTAPTSPPSFLTSFVGNPSRQPCNLLWNSDTEMLLPVGLKTYQLETWCGREWNAEAQCVQVGQRLGECESFDSCLKRDNYLILLDASEETSTW
jgi:hypothetical protein